MDKKDTLFISRLDQQYFIEDDRIDESLKYLNSQNIIM